MREGKRVFWDMDGTLVNPFDIPDYLQKMNESYEFFFNLPEYKNMLGALILFVEKHSDKIPSKILSAGNGNPGCLPGKDFWLDTKIPNSTNVKIERIYTEIGKPKAAFIEGGIGPGDYLIDDFSKNLLEWEAHGGTGIKLINQINGSGKNWNKACVNIQDEPEAILAQIEKIIFE